MALNFPTPWVAGNRRATVFRQSGMGFRWRLVLAIVTVAVFSSACAQAQSNAGAGATASSGSPPAGAQPWVKLLRTGGFAGVRDEVTIDQQGGWTSRNKAGDQRFGQLDQATMDQLRTLARDPNLPVQATRSVGPTRCRDAFEYDVTVATLRLSYVDCPSDPELPQAWQAIVDLVGRSVFG